MPEYIDRSALLNEYNIGCRTAQERYIALVNAPEADVVEVKHGRWEKNKAIGSNYKQCSCCKYDFARLYPDNFCPNCGARMEVGNERH